VPAKDIFAILGVLGVFLGKAWQVGVAALPRGNTLRGLVFFAFLAILAVYY